MAKRLRDEDLRLNIIINGDAGRKEMAALERQIHDTGAKVDDLVAKRKQMEAQGQKDSAEYRKLTSEINKSTKALDGYRTRLETLRRQQSVNTMTLAELRKHISTTTIALNKAVPGTEQWTKLNAELKLSKARLAELQAQSKVTGTVMQNMANKINRYIGIITAGFASMAFVISGIDRSRKDFADLDEAVADVMKTTGLAKEEVMEMNEELKKYDTRTAQNKLLDLAHVAGKLGFTAEEDVEAFVRSADKINVALSRDLGGNAEEAINQVGKLVDIFGLKEEFGIEQSMLKIGSAINELGMASTANEGYLVNFAKRVAGVAPNADIAITDVLGLAGTLDSLGQTAEVSGTAYGMVITGMYKKTDVFARVAGMRLQDFKKLMEEDMNEAFVRVLEGIGNSGSMDAVVQSLNAIGLDGQRCTMVLGALANNTDELRRQQELSNKAFEEGTSLLNEFAVKNNTTQAKLEKAKKSIVEQSVALGEKLVPAINVSLSGFTYLIKLLGSLIDVGTKYGGVIIALTTVLTAHWVQQKASVAWAKLQAFWSAQNRIALAQEAAACGTATAGTQLLCAAKNLLVGNLKAATVAMKGFFASLGPVGWLTIGIGALAGAFSLLKNRAKDAKNEMTATERATKGLNDALKEQDLGIGNDILKIEKLSRSWKELGENMSAKEQFIRDNRQAFDDLGISINTVNEGDLLFIERTEDFIAAMKLRAEATVADKLAGEAMERALKAEKRAQDEQQKLNNTPKYEASSNVVISTTGTAPGNYQGKQTENADYVAIKKRRDEANAEAAAARIEANAYYDLAEARRVAADAKYKAQKPITTTTTVGGIDAGEWSLEKDKAFQEERLALLEKYNTGEIASKEEYEAQLLQLEIDYLARRIELNADSEETLLSLNTQYQEKLKEQKEVAAKADQELMKYMASDKVAEENALYEAQKKRYAGNKDALEAVERAHQARLGKIALEMHNDKAADEKASYLVERRMMESHHKQELESFEGTKRELNDLRKKQWKELNDLDEKYLNEMIAQLTNLIDNGDVGDIEIGVELSDADKANLLKQLADLKAELAKLQNTAEGTQDKPSGEFWGLSQKEWDDLFAGNIAGWENWCLTVTDIVESASKDLMELWGSVNDYMEAKEEAQLKLYEKNNDQKKKSLEQRLNKGIITESQYNSAIEALDAEYDAYQEELQLKQARRQKAMNITQAIINTALGVTKTLAEWGIPQGLIPAGIMSAMGAAQIALIAATPINVDGAAVGGDIFVNRNGDDRRFKARLSPDQRGWVTSPTVLVGEEGPEYVIPADGVNNPALRPLLSTIEVARRNGTLRSLKASAIYPTMSMPGYVHGGFTTTQSAAYSSAIPSSIGIPMNDELAKQLVSTLADLNEKMSGGIQAYVVMVGKNGLVEQMKKYESMKQKANIYG
ncbi:MAG: phage tail tape measure protein [Tidjanibacter sp.]|nr:phage tail tape measure protein [Tidjanibacter sp.]